MIQTKREERDKWMNSDLLITTALCPLVLKGDDVGLIE